MAYGVAFVGVEVVIEGWFPRFQLQHFLRHACLA
jgi:hypothetical protein